MSTYDNTDRNAYVALGLVFGTLAGIGVGILMAPRSGQETRSRLRVRAVAAKLNASRQFALRREKAMESVSRSLDKSKALIDTAASKTKSVTDQTAQRAKTAATRAQAETATRRARRTGRPASAV